MLSSRVVIARRGDSEPHPKTEVTGFKADRFTLGGR
jgi:hypothetical protein